MSDSSSGIPRDPRRRKALQDMTRFGGGAAVAATMLTAFGVSSRAKPAQTLRPPGALPEKDFLAACVRCGLCVRDCPYDTLKLADWADGPAMGTPFYVARNVPCEMCDTIPCVKACPTGALEHALTDIAKAKMGVAVITSRETCLNLQGLRCDVCYRVCPAIDKAITLEVSHNARTTKHAIFEPVVHAESCTGCGKCEKSCVLTDAAIKVLPIEVAALKQDAHYKRGWEEKSRAGGALVDAPLKLPVRRPEGGTP
ncbi:ferredoxin-type protein NapG [Bradyrhizobium ottawaense]|uniref:Ferredoxin-type protein NapG n=1 Tax=Bradyrhizobium ottawaense TaxID=931866 RepID=A0A2U8P8W3_9BRAD|nr:ferredoxin-type protein NapG [Bradyrhizobium ottawaense]AWL94181.1 ferredoxin-type protein NapG [Bradyrhizobium ottawaense]MBR1327339.1 ferredoxin-type protein NapG [Bradyrhizobium ottawaense]MBR1336274.1 ferredoxin-type protein NapG [Bradyrhizobium ottawaense]